MLAPAPIWCVPSALGTRDEVDIQCLLATAHLTEGDFDLTLDTVDAALTLKPGDVYFTRIRQLVNGHRVYQNNMLEKRHSPYLNNPPVVHLETYAKCNANCTFCPYETWIASAPACRRL